MFGYSFMNYNCMLRRVAKGASRRDYYGEPLVFLGYSHRWPL